MYRWDEKAEVDRPIKENDHCLTGDTVVNTVFGGKKIKDLVGKSIQYSPRVVIKKAAKLFS